MVAGNPPTLSLLPGGGICLTYGYREPPYGLRYLVSGKQTTRSDPSATVASPYVLRATRVKAHRVHTLQMGSGIALVSVGAKK